MLQDQIRYKVKQNTVNQNATSKQEKMQEYAKQYSYSGIYIIYILSYV